MTESRASVPQDQPTKVLLSYGPNGRSRGEATVTFNTATGAAEAQKQYHGVKVDNRAMKIEIVGGTVAAAKPLQERIAKPKSAAKDATKGSTKGATAKANGKAATANNAAAATTTTETGKGRATKKKSGRAGRAKAKTAEELDAEMQDYFGGGEANGVAATTVVTTNGAQPAAAVVNGGDTGMEDEVL
nr:mrna export protein mlo3 [Quercus suber]